MFTARIVSLLELFASSHRIEAPSYQRAFSWTWEEAAKLLDDISLALDEAKSGATGEYFLGTMLFIDREGKASTPARPPSRLSWRTAAPPTMGALEIVDGFQRLTTLTILWSCLRDKDAEAGLSQNPRLLGAIQGEQGANASPRLVLRETEEKFFLDHVRAPGATSLNAGTEALSLSEERILEVRDHILSVLGGLEAAERRRLADFLLDRCCVVLVATTGIDRAHRMFTVLNTTGKELARKDILKAFLLGNAPSAVAAHCLAVWDAADALLGTEFENLFSHVRAMYGRPGDQIITGIIEIAKSVGEQAFIEGVLQPAAGFLDDIHNARHSGTPQSASISQYLRYLGWHAFADWKPVVLAWWMRNGDDAEALNRFLARLDRMTFGIRILGIGSSKRAHRFGAVINAIQAGDDVMGHASPLQLTRAELRTIQHNLRDMHGRHSATAKHLLLRLTDAKAGKCESSTLPSNMTVEHVLPKKLSTKSQWREWHPDPEERERCTDSLGNLVLVTKEQNDKASNLDFARKLQIYFNTPGAPAVALNEDLRGRTVWKANEIEAREASLFRLIEELWQLGMVTPRAQAAE